MALPRKTTWRRSAWLCATSVLLRSLSFPAFGHTMCDRARSTAQWTVGKVAASRTCCRPQRTRSRFARRSFLHGSRHACGETNLGSTSRVLGQVCCNTCG